MSTESFARLDRELEDVARNVGDFRLGTPGYAHKALVRAALAILDSELDALRNPVEISKSHQLAALVREALGLVEAAFYAGIRASGEGNQSAAVYMAQEAIRMKLEALEKEA